MVRLPHFAEYNSAYFFILGALMLFKKIARYFSLSTIIFSTSLIFLSACSIIDYQNMTEEQLYKGAMEELDNDSYRGALNYLREIETRFPFGVYAEQAQLEMMYSYYQDGKYEIARAKASSFIRLNPNSPQLDYALYIDGLSAWEMGKNMLEGMKMVDIEKRDLGATKDSFASFYRLVSEFKDSRYAPDARQRILFLKNMIAAQEIYIARFYLRRGAPEAAIGRANFVIQHLHSVASILDAFAVLAEGYTHLEVRDKAKYWVDRLKKIAPKHEQLSDGKLVMLYPPDSLDKNFWQFITFDLAK